MPALRRGIRRQYDAARGQDVLQGPERVFVLDDIAGAIAGLLDGKRSVSDISALLAARYAAEPAEVEADVLAFVQELATKNLVTL